MICIHSCFDGKLPKSLKDYAGGQDPNHYYHHMPNNLMRLLDGTRVTVVMEGAKMAEMLYNVSGWLPMGGEYMGLGLSWYGFEPTGSQCFSWFTNDEIGYVCQSADHHATAESTR